MLELAGSVGESGLRQRRRSVRSLPTGLLQRCRRHRSHGGDAYFFVFLLSGFVSLHAAVHWAEARRCKRQVRLRWLAGLAVVLTLMAHLGDLGTRRAKARTPGVRTSWSSLPMTSVAASR